MSYWLLIHRYTSLQENKGFETKIQQKSENSVSEIEQNLIILEANFKFHITSKFKITHTGGF